jgi:hypothetical protein
VIVVDQARARRFFPGKSAVGKRLKGGGCSTCDWTTVVGVVSPVSTTDSMPAIRRRLYAHA